jgi:hypothetical protein
MHEKILIKTGSHYFNAEWNKTQRKRINDILFDEKNPFYKLFNEEHLYLDKVDGFISLVQTNHYEDFSKRAPRIARYILQHVEFDGPSYIYVGDCAVRRIENNKIIF